MVDLRIGTGGWAYFHVPGIPSLKAYSSAFDFVEVNSTYYEYPSLESVARWRKSVPSGFEFAVRCNKEIMTGLRKKDGGSILSVAEKMGRICKILDAGILSLLLHTDGLAPETLIEGLELFLSNPPPGNTLPAVEVRGSIANPSILKVLKDHQAIHSVDLSRENPTSDSRTLYSRLFGNGKDNIYEFDDEELKAISAKASRPRFEKSILAFHGVRMYRDAARLKTFLRTHEFPNITGKIGLQSLDLVLREDARFPTPKRKLLESQGWKLFDLSENKRARAGKYLELLPDGNYSSPQSVIQTLEGVL